MLYSVWKKAIDIVNATFYVSTQANSEVQCQTKSEIFLTFEFF